jgi:hypothetical protein
MRTTDQRPETFRSDAFGALSAVQRALADVLRSVAPTGTKALTLARVLQVDKSLAWRVCRFVAEPDVFVASAHLPGESGLRIFARAIRAGQVPMPLVEALDRALDGLDAVVRQHARTRASFRAMLAQSADPSGEDPRVVDYRKAAFHANAAIWGIDADVRAALAFVTRGDEPGRLDLTLVSGSAGIHRLRRDTPWTLFQRRVERDGKPLPTPSAPLDPALAADAIPLLADHSTVRAADLCVDTADGRLRCWLPPGDVGRAVAMDCFFAERYRALLPARRRDGIEFADITLRHEIPAEHSLVELWVERGIGLDQPPDVLLYSMLAGELEGTEPQRAHRRLPLAAAPRPIDGARPDAGDPAFPRHAELLAAATARLGTPLAAMAGHRVTLRYPVLSTALVLRLRLPTDG